ncbi:MFS transporter [Candidatus Peregrinibacteria bacterium]|nr:MAG: MFS transporter [Candidatus Peregrinibacteria bacterium]
MVRKLMPILLLSFVNVLGFSLLMPVLPEVLVRYTGESSGLLYGFLLSSYALSQFIAAPILGAWSDHYGRRPILLLSQLGTLLSWFIFAAAYFIPADIHIAGVSLPLLVIAFSRITDGLTGGNISVAQAWISDRTEAHEKTKAFGLAGAVFGFGFLVGPALGGLSVSGPLHFLGTAILASAISLVTLGFIYWRLPESLHDDHRSEKPERSLLAQLNFSKRLALFKHNPVIKNLLAVRVMFSLAFVGFTTSLILLLKIEYLLNAVRVGTVLSLIGIFAILNQAWVVPKISERLGSIKTFFSGLILSSVGVGVLALLPIVFGPVFGGVVVVLFYALMYFLNLGIAMVMTTFRTIITLNTAPNRQGQATGLDESLTSLGQGVVPLFAGTLYDFIGPWSFALYASVLFVFSVRAYVRMEK